MEHDTSDKALNSLIRGIAAHFKALEQNNALSNVFDNELDRLTTDLASCLSQYPAAVFTNDHYFSFMLLLKQITQLRINPAFRQMVLVGEFGLQLDRLVDEIHAAIAKHAIFQESAQASSIINLDQEISQGPSVEAEGTEAMAHILATARQEMDALWQKNTTATSLAAEKNAEAEVYFNQLKAIKFSQNGSAAITPEMQQKAIKLSSEMSALNVAAFVVYDLATSSRLYYEEMLREATQ